MQDSPDALELLSTRAGERLRLGSPAVGLYTGAVEPGRVLVPGETAGWLVTLGRARGLLVPASASGVVGSQRPERVHHPVGYGDLLLELDPLEIAGAVAVKGSAPRAGGEGSALWLRASSAGRFWHRAAPSEPPLVAAGQVIEDGAAIGLLEVMKTFSQVLYRPRAGLPARARVVRVVAADGADVDAGDALLELEPA